MDKSSTILQRFNVVRPTNEDAIAVGVTHWKLIMSRIESCKDSSQMLDNAGWFCLGISASCILVAITFPFMVEFVKTLPSGAEKLNLPAFWAESACILLAIGLLVGGVAALTFGYLQRRTQTGKREWIIEDMRIHMEKHPSLSSAALPAKKSLPTEAAHTT